MPAHILHLDLDAFFAAVEQRDKPSLRGKPVVVGGLSSRGVVATASYEARKFGIHSAMSMGEARRRCPNAAFLRGRFPVYKQVSAQVMGLLRELSPIVEPLSLDEAFVDLRGGAITDFSSTALRALADNLRTRLTVETGGLTASVGLGSSRFIAKIATELGKPNGVYLVEPGDEIATIAPLSARAIPGVGPVTMDKLTKLGVKTIGDLQALSKPELVRELGTAAGESLFGLAHAKDDRAVEADQEVKSISMEDTFDTDLNRSELAAFLNRDAAFVAQRLAEARLYARTISIKVRLPDFTTYTRSRTLAGATDRVSVIARVARDLLDGLNVSAGVRLFGVGTSGFTSVAQESLFEVDDFSGPVFDEVVPATSGVSRREATWVPGADVVHAELGPGWVWGAGLGRVTVRFETAETGPGPVHTFRLDDPALTLC